ncbi:hypothetical protein AGJ19_21655 [Cronobacter sakazakii]|nr:hypothetical protein [Cronobacter sakazakii]EJG0831443.1 hypothetical protein [Cronobacter sakazakii]
MTDTAKLKAAAEKATPGRVGDRIDGSGSIKYRCVGADGSLVLLTDHKNNEYGFVGDNGEADELFFRLCTPEAVLELIAALEAAENRNAELEACVSNLQVNRPVVYGYGFYDGYWKARSEQSMSSEDENHG